MSDLVHYVVLSFISIFVIVDPIGLIPAFLSLTEKHSLPERLRTARVASLCTFGVLSLFLFLGPDIFKIFSISLPAFEIAGGIVLMIVALDMLQARSTGLKESHGEMIEGVDKDEVAVTPLSIPMLAGPGSITTVILLNHRASDLGQRFVLWGVIAVVCVFTFAILRYTAVTARGLSVIALRIITRLMGLVLTAVSVQFILDGIRQSGLLAGL